jgi:DNA-binding NarL/FixJ family response regulator
VPVCILIADDNLSVRAAMRSVLECVGERWEIIEAADGEEAVAKAKEFEPDLVILDLVMPRADGLNAAREISSLLPETPILMHTLYSSIEVDAKAATVGVRKVVPKSDSRVLVSAVQEVLDTKPPAALGYVSEPSSSVSFKRRKEDRIRELSTQLFALGQNKGHSPLLAELRDVLHQHIEQLRARVADFPVVERRLRSRIAPSNAATQEPKVKQPNPAGNPILKPAVRPEPPAKTGSSPTD